MNYIDKVIHGDCIEVMMDIPSKSVDLVLTDPPYNCPDIGPHHKKYDTGSMQLPPNEYKKFCWEWFRECRRISNRIIFTPGIRNTHNYPQPTWQICWYKPAAVSYNGVGGFNVWEPIFCYTEATGRNSKPRIKAKGLRLQNDVIECNTKNFTKGWEKDHPCPKPYPLWARLVEIFSVGGG